MAFLIHASFRTHSSKKKKNDNNNSNNNNKIKK